MNKTSDNTSGEVTLFDNNVMATINKLKNQYKRADLGSIYKELKKKLELKGTVMQIKKALINDRLDASKLS